MKVQIITVNYNNSQHTINLINNLENRLLENEQLIIVDNNSEAFDVSAIKQHISKIKFGKAVILIENLANLGYFKAINTGIESLKNRTTSRIIIGNNDIEFADGFFTKVRNIHIENDELVICPDILTDDGKHQNPHSINRVSFKKKIWYAFFFRYYLVHKIGLIFSKWKKKSLGVFNNEEMAVSMAHGACMILTENFFKYYDRLLDDVFMWGEEALLSHQIRKVNGVIRYMPSLKVYHHENTSSSKIPSYDKFLIKKKSYLAYKKYL